MNLGKDLHLKISAKTGNDLRMVCGKLQGRDGFYTTYDGGIAELIRFWNEYNHLEQEIIEKLIV